MTKTILYHTGYSVIKEPDIHYGRKNADFGQGFYLTADAAFAERWARERRGEEIFINTYELESEGLSVREFAREEEWFNYIFRNRGGREDLLGGYDVISGPVANDTIFDTFGIITSGFLSAQESLQLLLVGPEYRQTVIKTEKAAANLRWISARRLEKEEKQRAAALLKAEEEEYQKEFAAVFDRMR